MAEKSFGHGGIIIIVLSISMCYCAAHFSKENLTHTASTRATTDTVAVEISKSITLTLRIPRTSVHEVLVASTTQTYSFCGSPTSTKIKQAHINLFANPRDISQPRCCLARLHTYYCLHVQLIPFHLVVDRQQRNKACALNPDCACSWCWARATKNNAKPLDYST